MVRVVAVREGNTNSFDYRENVWTQSKELTCHHKSESVKLSLYNTKSHYNVVRSERDLQG